MSVGRLVVGLVVGVAGCEGASVCAAPGELCLAAAEATRTHWSFAPDSLQWADVDGDGVADLAAASHVRGTVSVMWGAGAWLGEATTWSVAPEVVGLVVADVDADGRLDLVTAVPGREELAVLRGRGERTFEMSAIAVGASPRAVIAAEMFGGGVVELVTVNGEGSVSVVSGERVISTVVVGSEPRAVAAGDLDRDGDLDLAVAVAGSATLQTLRNEGDGLVVVGEGFAVGWAPESVVAADLDADGVVDLATADVLGGSVSVLFGDGAGGVKKQAVWPTEPQPQGLVVVPGADPRLAVVSRKTGVVQTIDPRTGEGLRGVTDVYVTALAIGAVGELVYSGSGQVGTMVAAPGVRFEQSWEIDDIEVGGRVFAVDLEGDDVDELVVVNFDPREQEPGELLTSKVTLLRGGEVEAELEMGTQYVTAVVAMDLDGDGSRELVLFDRAGMVVARQREQAWEVSPVTLVPWRVFVSVVVDVDGDGRSELLLAQGNAVEVLGGDGEAGLVSLQSFLVSEWSADGAPPGSLGWLKTVDVDGDEQLDVVGFVDGVGLVVREDVLQAERPVRSVAIGVDRIDDLELVDFDEDGALDGLMCTVLGLTFVSDVLGASPGVPVRVHTAGCDTVTRIEGSREVLVMDRRAQQVVVTPWAYDAGEWQRGASAVIDAPSAELVRLDDDGWIDVVSSGIGEVTRGWRMSRGDGLIDAPLRWIGGAGLAFPDLDGDGVLDLFAYGNGLAAAYGDGAGGFSPLRHGALPVGAQRVNSAAVGDFDEDGRDEVVLSVQPLDAWRSDVMRVVVSADGFEVSEVARLDRWGARLIAGDLDQDGRRDVVAHEEKLGVVLLRNEGDGFAAPRWLAELGVTSLSGRVMDIDDDGRFDFVGRGTQDVFVLRGLGEGRLAARQTWWSSRRSGGLEFADVTGDGRKDLLAIDSWTNVLMLVQGTGAGPRWLADGVSAVTAGDLDMDGRPELLIIGAERTAGVAELMIGRWGADGPSFERVPVAADGVAGLQARDFDGDGVLDVALIGSGDVTIVRQER